MQKKMFLLFVVLMLVVMCSSCEDYIDEDGDEQTIIVDAYSGKTPEYDKFKNDCANILGVDKSQIYFIRQEAYSVYEYNRYETEEDIIYDYAGSKEYLTQLVPTNVYYVVITYKQDKPYYQLEENEEEVVCKPLYCNGKFVQLSNEEIQYMTKCDIAPYHISKNKVKEAVLEQAYISEGYSGDWIAKIIDEVMEN